MKLADLRPNWLSSGGPGVSNKDPATGKLVPAPKRDGMALTFDCPCGCKDPVIIPILNPFDGGPPAYPDGHGWTRSGTGFVLLTLSPSIRRVDGCRWHFNVTNGEIIEHADCRPRTT